jgi:hypothetical protein
VQPVEPKKKSDFSRWLKGSLGPLIPSSGNASRESLRE